MNGDFVKSGTLTKQGNVRKNWKRRLFRLHRNGQLSYCKDPLKPVLGSIDIKGQCIGLLHGNQCHCQWPLNVPKPNCFGIMTPVRVYHVYADSPDDVEDWISVLRHSSDVLRRRDSLSFEQGDLYQNLQAYPSGAENEEVESDPDEIFYEDVVKDTEDDPLYSTLPATSIPTTPQINSQSCPPLPSRTSTSSTQLVDEVFQMADELDDVLGDFDTEVVYESLPADQDIPVEQLKTPDVDNSAVVADGVEDGDFYAEVTTEMIRNLPQTHTNELYDDVASNNEDKGPPLDSEVFVEELYDDVATPADVPQLVSVAAQEVATLVEVEKNSEDHVLEGSGRVIKDEVYDAVTDDQHNVDEVLYDDVAPAASANTGRPVASASDQEDDLWRQQQQEQNAQEDFYDDIITEVNEAARQFKDSQLQRVEQANIKADSHTESEISNEVTNTLLSSGEQFDLESTGVIITAASSEQMSLGNDRQQSVVSSDSTKSRSSISKLSTPMIDIQTDVVKQVQEVQNGATTMSQDTVLERAHEPSNDATESKVETNTDQFLFGSSVRSHASAQKTGKKLEQSKKHWSKPNHESAAEKRQSSEFMKTVAAVRKGATTWSKSGSRQKEKDAKLRQSRIVKEEAERQIAEWKALHSKLFQKRDQRMTSNEASAVETNQTDGVNSRDEKAKEKGTDQSVKPSSDASKEKPMPPKKPLNIAAVVLQHQKMKSTNQTVSSTRQTLGDNQQDMMATKRQQNLDRKSQLSKVSPASTVTAKDETSAAIQKDSTNTKNESQSTAFKAQVNSTKAQCPALPMKPVLPPRPSLSGLASAVTLAAQHSKQIKEWERKRQEVFAAEKARQERRVAEEKRRHEEQAKQNRQAQLLEAEKVRQAKEKSAWTQGAQSKLHSELPTKNTTLMHTNAAGRKDKSEMMHTSATGRNDESDKICQAEQVVGKTAKVAPSSSKDVYVSKDDSCKELCENALLSSGAEAEVTTSEDVLTRSPLDVSVVQPILKSNSNVSGAVQCSSLSHDHEQSSASLKEKNIVDVIQQFEGKQASGVVWSPAKVTLPQLKDKEQAGSVTMSTTKTDVLEHGNSRHSTQTALQAEVADKVSVNSSLVMSREPKKSHHFPTPVASLPSRPQINNVAGQSTESKATRDDHCSVARSSVIVNNSSDTTSSEKKQTDDENPQINVVDQDMYSVENSNPNDGQKTLSNEAQTTTVYEPQFTEVQIREKKTAARRKAAALSWPLEMPPSDPYGAEGGNLRDDDPMMTRKLSVVARGANAMAKAFAAARWIDKEIRKLIAEIQTWGSPSTSGKYEVTFGVLFEECSTVFEALSGTLKTAKKHGVVQFAGELLLQGVHNSVVVTLLKTSIPDSNADTYTYQQFRACSISVHKRKGKAFGKTTQQTSQSKCFVCGKTVYPMEYVSANDHPMHKICFKCCDCGKKLSSGNYAVLQDNFFCINHYEQRFKQQGGYGGFQ